MIPPDHAGTPPPRDANATPPRDADTTPPRDAGTPPPRDANATPPRDADTTPPRDAGTTPSDEAVTIPPGNAARPDPVPLLPADEPNRRRAREELGTSFLVEAGAGSGKTRLLVERMAALVESGQTDVSRIAAVTFTRKAAAELRERFQVKLEESYRAERRRRPESGKARRLRRGIDEIDRAFLGTIHAFCARLLRERPIEAGLDPDFVEVPEAEAQLLQDRFWTSFLERTVADSDPLLEQLARTGLRAEQLRTAFNRMVENLDVEYPAPAVPPPGPEEIRELRGRMREILERALRLMPRKEPAKGWDRAQETVRSLRYMRHFRGWRVVAALFDAAERMCSVKSLTLNRWPQPTREGDAEVRALRSDFGVLAEEGSRVRRLLDHWFAHRYGLVIAFVRRAAVEFAEERLRMGMLNFHDLLMLTARLLREHPGVRRDLGERFRYVLIDEFQDTDPIQAELLFLLASEPDDPRPDNGSQLDDVPGSRDGPRPGDGRSDDAAEPDDPPHPADWRTVVPRPGALFVVGDPKQSIYRFRRADIVVYNQVRARFEAFGAVLPLTTNFRSRQTLAGMVNEVFDHHDRFPREETDRQARFAPMVPHPRDADGPEGVFVYDVPKARKSRDAARLEADMLASWIRARIESGERRAGDFLVLTRQKAHLDLYARALEERNVTIEVSGAQAGPEEELRELILLLQTLIDPGNPVNVVAVLTGLFFGLDHEQLAAHALAGGRFDFTYLPGDRERAGDPAPDTDDPGAEAAGDDDLERTAAGDDDPADDAPGPEVAHALATLHAWWRESRREPADILIGRLADRLGLMPYVASGRLGTLRCGILAYALDSVRAGALQGDASLAGAVEALEAALEWEDAEAPFNPGHDDAVRVMNLHKAKGLEATVVILANPGQGISRRRRPDSHTRRGAKGGAEAFTTVSVPAGAFHSRVLAQPSGWPDYQSDETRFLEAEEQRILYVACTRAREELVIARKKGKSCWGIFDAWLGRNARTLQLALDPPPPRERLGRSAAELIAETDAAADRLRAGAEPSYEFASVTELAKEGVPGEERRAQAPEEADGEGMAARTPDEPNGDGGDAQAPRRADGGERDAAPVTVRGYEWGSAVHGTLAAAARGVGHEALEFIARALLVEHERPVNEEGAPIELGELMSLVERVRDSALWRRAERAEARHPEVPFAVERPGTRNGGPVRAPEEEDSPAHRDAPPGTRNGGVPRFVEGVIDLAFREPDGWVIVDYKTDVGDDPDFPRRRLAYRRQVDLYAECWEAVTGEPVKERVLLFTTMEEEETW